MLMDRVIRAFTFRREVYAEVEPDTSFTTTAWTLVAAIAFLNQLGALAGGSSGGGWILGAIVGTAVNVLAFAVGAYVIAWVGKAMFQAQVTFEEMVRTLGLAYVWNGVGFIGVLAAFLPLLACILTPVICLAAIMGLVSWFIATQEALDLDTTSTAITVVIGWVVTFVVSLAGGFVRGLLGFAGSSLMSAFGG